jgi:Fe-S oxidoreductase
MSKVEEQDIFKKALDCVRCGSCRVIYTDRIKSMRFGKQCPPGTYHLIESFYPAGLMYLAVGLMREQFPYSQRAVEAVYACTLCGYCQTICEEYVETKTMPVIGALRNKAVREGVGPLPGQKACIENLKKTDNILGEPREKRVAWLKGFPGPVKFLDKGDKASTLYFPGCQYSCNPSLEDVPGATAEIFSKAGIDWGILGEQEKCCGYLALALGYPEIFERYAQENAAAFNRLGVKQIVTSCPECYSTLKLRYPEVAPLEAEVIHTTDLFYRLVEEKRLKLKESKGRVTYHDPCHLGRYCYLYEQPRKVIQSIPGIELVEMERNRMDAWCCGAGGGVSMGNREYALATARDRIEEALSTGAEALITSCPNCALILGDAGKRSKTSMPVEDIASFLCRSLVKS